MNKKISLAIIGVILAITTIITISAKVTAESNLYDENQEIQATKVTNTETNVKNIKTNISLSESKISTQDEKSDENLKNLEDAEKAEVEEVTFPNKSEEIDSTIAAKEIATTLSTLPLKPDIEQKIEDAIEKEEKEAKKKEEKKQKKINNMLKKIDDKFTPHIEETHTYDDYDLLVRLIYGEAGNEDFTGKCLVAQTIKNTMEYENTDSVSYIIKTYKYSGNTKLYDKDKKNYPGYDGIEKAWKECKEAVKLVFDEGYDITDKVMFFYAFKTTKSKFHESQIFVCQHGGHRFFWSKNIG